MAYRPRDPNAVASFTTLIASVRNWFSSCCRDEEEEEWKPVIGQPFDFRREDVTIPGLSLAEQQHLRTRTTTSSNRLLSTTTPISTTINPKTYSSPRSYNPNKVPKLRPISTIIPSSSLSSPPKGPASPSKLQAGPTTRSGSPPKRPDRPAGLGGLDGLATSESLTPLGLQEALKASDGGDDATTVPHPLPLPPPPPPLNFSRGGKIGKGAGTAKDARATLPATDTRSGDRTAAPGPGSSGSPSGMMAAAGAPTPAPPGKTALVALRSPDGRHKMHRVVRGGPSSTALSAATSSSSLAASVHPSLAALVTTPIGAVGAPPGSETASVHPAFAALGHSSGGTERVDGGKGLSATATPTGLETHHAGRGDAQISPLLLIDRDPYSGSGGEGAGGGTAEGGRS